MPGDYNRTFNPRFGAELNIESIIGAPLVAASKANVMMLTGQARFLLDYCFEQEAGNDLRRPVMVSMVLRESSIDGDGIVSVNEIIFQVPLLCLLPLNSLAIDNVNVDFDLEITSVGSYAYKPEENSNMQLVERKAVLNGRLAPPRAGCRKKVDKQYANTLSSCLKVNIHASGLPLPKGVLTILDMYTKSIRPIELKEKL